ARADTRKLMADPSPAPDPRPPAPRVMVMGAGAVGGYFGGLLARAGVETTFVARGAHLEAMRGNGLRVRSPQGDFHLPARAVGDPREAGAAELVLFCTKSHDTEEAARALAPALGETTAVLTLQNGVENEAVLGAVVGEPRVLPGVAYVSAAVEVPGVIRHMAEGSLAFGEADGSASERARAVEALFRHAGVKALLSENIWGIKWAKLAWNATFNTLNALVGGTFDRIGTDEALLGVGEGAMREIAAVAAAAGVRFPERAVARGLAWARQALPIKTSTLQDLEAGKRLELDALTGAVVRKAAALGVPVPTVAALHALLAARCRS
ncbi:MAG TPA: 2-dehydropantoate 2-reductase, partial [Candidatus Methylomirabilis sp.]